jgi:hypothetical protein
MWGCQEVWRTRKRKREWWEKRAMHAHTRWITVANAEDEGEY